MNKILRCTKCGRTYKHVGDPTCMSYAEDHYWKNKKGVWMTRCPTSSPLEGRQTDGCISCGAKPDQMVEVVTRTAEEYAAEEKRRKAEDTRNNAPWIR